MRAGEVPVRCRARVLRVVGNREARRVLESLGVTERALEVLKRSVLHRVVHVGPLSNDVARTLRREMTRLGGEAALPEAAWEGSGTTEALLAGTLRHYEDLRRALSVADPDQRAIGDEIESALARDAHPPSLLRMRGTALPLDRTLVMGVLNVTPDSFSDGGHYLDPGAALEHAEEMEAEGADIIDVGGASSRPGAEDVPVALELERVMPVLEKLPDRVKVAVSIDTIRAEVARQALEAGAAMVNDISALGADPHMACIVAESGAACVLMHMRGNPQTMRDLTDYDNLVADVYSFLADRAEYALDQGVKEDRLLVDPGIGFAKDAAQSLALLQRLGEFRSLGMPLVVGTSRKSFIGAVLETGVKERTAGTLATVAWAVAKGAHVVRVHDVAPAAQTVRMVDAIISA